MGSQHTDRTVNQLRGDIYGLYELSDKIKNDVVECDRTVRDVHLRLGRLERTSERHFGLLLTTQREHGQRLDRVESQLGDVTTQLRDVTTNLDELAPLPAQVATLTTQVSELTSRFDQLTSQYDQLTSQVGELAALPARFVPLETQMGKLQKQVDQLEGTIHQNSRTLDTVVELLRKQQPAQRRDELEPPF
ncbi:hypothetical protein [Nocardia brasiliensis]|uniref:hypothetical protein n=1 Tax=Nocardia brasiliensis TaxID=37326 RepID=UPI002456832C|nr:hypothetical protein [Nocardia brasiliensis]